MQRAITEKILLCRMVRDSLDRTVAPSQRQNHATETQEPAGSERAQSPEQVVPESTEPTERQLDLQFWSKLKCEKGTEPWGQVSTRV